ncbi:hypothetical protein [Fusibacter sp. JL216-2]|uniref:hypothetical protein n=1 Tax=Fusibacter sp. JL216-2 TaxID=3071453 RepID=UPI003D3290B8
MDQSKKDTLNFCIEFIKNNFREHSQVSMCLVWVKQAVDILDASPEISSAGFIVNELSAIEKYLTGSDTSSTSEDINGKLQMIEQLIAGI